MTENLPGTTASRGAVSPPVIAAATAWCTQHGSQPEHLSIGRRTLEDAFFDLTGAYTEARRTSERQSRLPARNVDAGLRGRSDPEPVSCPRPASTCSGAPQRAAAADVDQSC